MRIETPHTPQMPVSAPQPETLPPFRDGLRHDWTLDEIEALFALPFNDLMFKAQTIHRAHFDANAVQRSTLLSIKTGGCPEDCGYCAQSVHYDTPVKAEKMMAVQAVLAEARRAKEAGSTRYCMGAAWRGPKDRDLEKVCEMIRGVRELGMESCVTLGMLTPDQAARLHDAGLDYYNHNIDTSAEFYGEVITTRTYQDRLDTLEYVRNAGINVCCGGIVGMGESRRDRASMLLTLVNLPQHPQSVPINMLMKVTGTPASTVDDLDEFEFIRTIAVARITMPESVVRLSAGRASMNDQTQALCFMAGANSIFIGPKLLTTDNPAADHDDALFERLGLHPLA
jgi:biotin synthase